MTTETSAPAIAPGAPQSDDTIYIVLQDFGALGSAYRETDPNHASRETVIEDLIRGEFGRPLRVMAFNIAEGWVKDVTSEIKKEVLRKENNLTNVGG